MRIVVKQRAINDMMTGPVQAWFVRDVGRPLVAQAKAQAPRGASGQLAADITMEVVNPGSKNFRIRVGNTSAMRVPRIDAGAPQSRALFVHEGTGLFGNGLGINDYIRPRRARMLSWVGRDGRRVFAMKVAGMKPNPYLVRALRAVMRSL